MILGAKRIAEPAALSDGNGGKERFLQDSIGIRVLGGIFAALLRADLKNLSSILDDLADHLPFADRQGERFFAVDILAGFHGVGGDFHMPMVGRGAKNEVDVTASKEVAIIVVNFAIPILGKALRVFFGAGPVHVGAGNEI